jgi:flagellar hook-associated protein 2
MAIGMSGLASGMDTSSLVEQLMSLERRPLVVKERQEQLSQARETTLKDVASRLRNLSSASADLRSVTTWAPKQAVESSDATKVGARWTAGAGAGGYEINVTQLARAAQKTFDYQPGAASVLTVNGRPYTIGAGADTATVVDEINNDSQSTVFASKVGNQIVLSSKTTGEDETITASSTAPPGEWAEDVARERLGRDAEYTVDGGPVRSSPTNVVANELAGVELTLKTTGTATISVGGPAMDQDAIKEKARKFVEQYNSTIDFIRTKVTEQKVKDPETAADRQKGMLKGDPLLSSLLGRLRSTMSEAVGSDLSMDQLAEIGITTGTSVTAGTVSADALAGKLSLDETKLGNALNTNAATVKKLLAGDGAGLNGLAQRVEGLVKPNTDTGGAIDERLKSLDGEQSRIRKSMDEIDRRLAEKEKRLKAQFAAMEQALAASQSQQSWLAQQTSSLLY